MGSARLNHEACTMGTPYLAMRRRNGVAASCRPVPLASPCPGPLPPPDHDPDAARPKRPLGMILLESGGLTSPDLMRALTIQRRENARLGDILRAHGMAKDGDVVRALAQQHGTSVLDPGHDRPDPRLIDLLGPARCLALDCLPWRRAGSITLVATSAPDRFAERRNLLKAVLGPIAMVVISESALHDALIGSRRNLLTLLAETCVKDRESCRTWNARRFSLLLALAMAALFAATLAAPMLSFLLLFGIVTLALVSGTLLRIAAAITQLRAIRGPTGPANLPVCRARDTDRKPVVTMMVPLFNEPGIAPRLVARLGALSYPRELLDVMLVVEEDDHLTRAALARSDLPRWMRVVPVPDSALRTKPRALNYALNFARGSIIGVYDAEDAPAPDQIHRVIERFAAGGPDLACVQGVLDYYNPATNWLSRCFTIEYAAWFRLILPGFEKLGLAVPLGGTTLFFRRDILESLGGWDAHNVTEDADLGIRLARHGYRTELLDTVTLEEANCRILPWIRQRSRWLKGYAMTYAVHMRDPLLLYRQLGVWRFFGFQVLFLGTLIQFLLAPILWSFWLMLLGLGHPLADALPTAALLAIATLFLLSEVANLAINLSALRSRDHRFLRPWTISLHLYFPLAAFAAYKGFWEMIISPYYWDKTHHGMHDSMGQPALVRA
ncbi:MAG: glycosyltransferase [Rhodobacteraceae bacterium HLUCCA12]|nr:MAG: glycosyltransferase [Rhodobacteraceae bacterium HLUCCA12]